MLPPVVEALLAHRAAQAAARLAAGQGAPDRGATMSSRRRADDASIRTVSASRSGTAPCPALASGGGRCTRPATRLRPTPWRPASHRRGWQPCSATPRQRCSSACTRGTSPTAPGATAVRARPHGVRPPDRAVAYSRFTPVGRHHRAGTVETRRVAEGEVRKGGLEPLAEHGKSMGYGPFVTGGAP